MIQQLQSIASVNLYSYLQKQHYLLNLAQLPAEHAHQEILILIQEKESTIKTMSQDLNKLRCENIKLNKAIKELQDKLSVNSGNNNNTGSTFMLASEFKTRFEEFMKQTLSTSLSNVLAKPKCYVGLVRQMFQCKYAAVQKQLSGIVDQVCNVLQLDPNGGAGEIRKKVFTQILKTLQDNCQTILKPGDDLELKTQLMKKWKSQGKSVRQTLSSPQIDSLLQQLHRLILYMLLQEHKWQFVFDTEVQPHQFSKKEFTCIDGWVKQKQDVYMVLQGLRKLGSQGKETDHPNLKNFVIPAAAELQDSMQSSWNSSICKYVQKPPIKQPENTVEATTKQENQNNPINQPQPNKEQQKAEELQLGLNTQQTVLITEHNSPLSPQPAQPTTTKQVLTASNQSNMQLLIQNRRRRVGKISGLVTDPYLSENPSLPQKKLSQPPILPAQLPKGFEDDCFVESRIINKERLAKKPKRTANHHEEALQPHNPNTTAAQSKTTKCVNIHLHKRQSSTSNIHSNHTEVSANSSKKSVGRIVHQSTARISSNVQSYLCQQQENNNHHTQRLMLMLSSHHPTASNKENIHGHSNNLLFKDNVFKEIMKSRCLKQERTMSIYRESNNPSKKNSSNSISASFNLIKTDRNTLESYHRREENRPCKPSAEHMAKVRQKHHLL